MTDTAQPTIPYISFVTLENYISSLADVEALVPDHIDKSMLGKLSGANQTALIKALEFLNLIEEDGGKTQESFARLVGAKRGSGDDWKHALHVVLDSAYTSIVGELNVAATTPMKLEEAFKAAGVKPGQMLAKSIRFYLKALQSAGKALPPHLLKVRTPKPPAYGYAPKKAAAKKAEAKTEETPKPEPPQYIPPANPPPNKPPSGLARQDIPTIEGAYIQYPIDMSEPDLALFEAALAFIRAVAKKGETS